MRTRRYSAAIVLTLVAISCGAPATPESSPRATTNRSPSNAIAVVRTTEGIDALNVDTQELLWSASPAVAAPDASAVVELVADGRLARRDPRTGATRYAFDVPVGVRPVVIAPDGGSIALSDRPPGYDSVIEPRPSTRILVVNGATGTVTHELTVAGDVEAEAFSLDTHSLFVLDHRGDHYRVQSIDLASGQRADLNSADKQPGEDMRGVPIHGVMSRNRQLLATLYVNPVLDRAPAFVHVLHLEGLTTCVDLPAEFAAGPARSQTIEREGDEIVVRAPAIGKQARFSLTTIASGGDSPPVITPDLGDAADTPYRSRVGFVALVGILPPTARHTETVT